VRCEAEGAVSLFVHASCGRSGVRWQQQATATATATPVRVFSSADGISRSREQSAGSSSSSLLFRRQILLPAPAVVVVIVYADIAHDDLTSPQSCHWDLIRIDTILLFLPNSTVTPSVCTSAPTQLDRMRPLQPASQPCCRACRRKTHVSPFSFSFIPSPLNLNTEHSAEIEDGM